MWFYIDLFVVSVRLIKSKNGHDHRTILTKSKILPVMFWATKIEMFDFVF